MYLLCSISQFDSSSERIEISSAHASVLRVILFVILNFPKSLLLCNSLGNATGRCSRAAALRGTEVIITLHITSSDHTHARAVSIVTAHKRVSDVNDRYYRLLSSGQTYIQHIVS